MIGSIRGVLIAKQPPQLLIEVNGLGYEVLAPLTTCEQLPEVQQTVHLYTHLSIREDGQTLYGFSELAARDFFRDLIKVNGIGPKVAMSILSSFSVAQIVQLIHAQGVSELTRIPGVGKKTAERLVMEMRDMLGKTTPVLQAGSGAVQIISSVWQDTLNALLALGYKLQEARHLLESIYKPDASPEELIRLALQQAGKGA